MGSLERVVAKRRDLVNGSDVKIGEAAPLSIDEQGRLLINGTIRSSAPALVALNSADPNGIKTSFSTVTATRTVLRAADYDGAEVSSGLLETARNVTITLSNTVGAFSTDPIKVSGLDAQGIPRAELLTPSSADGNETLATVNLFVGEVTIEIPAQADTDGSFQIGVGTAVAINPPSDGLFVETAGTMVVALADDEHTITVGTPENNFTLPYAVKSVHSITTAAGIRPVYG